MMPASRQTGFTLIELMVALLVGSIVVLGAGYLFLTTLQTFQTADELSRKQEAVIFAAHTLSESIRRGGANYDLTCLLGSSDECECTLRDTSEENKNQPLVTFDRPLGSTEPSDEDCALENPPDFSQDVVTIPLPLEKNGESIKFQVAKREPVLHKYLGSEDAAAEGNQQ